MTFSLHAQLEADSFPIANLLLCEARLMNNALFPWILLIPKRENASEITDLSSADQTILMQEIDLTSRAVHALFKPERVNVAALGNMVPQLHIHVIARFKNDAAWPAPVWGKDSAPYDMANAEKVISALKQQFLKNK